MYDRPFREASEDEKPIGSHSAGFCNGYLNIYYINDNYTVRDLQLAAVTENYIYINDICVFYF